MSNYYFNQVILIGNAGKAPFAFIKADGTATSSALSLATNKTWTHDGEEHTSTHWHTLIFNGRLHELAQAHIQKGDRLFIVGELAEHKSVDKTTGLTIHSTRVIVKSMRFLTKKAGLNEETSSLAEACFEECYQHLAE